MKHVMEFFEKNLNNVMAFVSCKGLIIQGGLEQKCKLVFAEHFGVNVLVGLEWNAVKIHHECSKALTASALNYDNRDIAVEAIENLIKNSYVNAANISIFNVTNINVEYKGDDVHTVKITYHNNAVIEIRCIEPIKEK